MVGSPPTGSLSQIAVRTEPLHNFWVDTAYRVPTTPDYSEDPKHPSEQSTPITRHATRAIFVTPEATAQLKRDLPVGIQGIAVDDGTGIRRVEASTDGGRSSADAALDHVIDKYSWRRWRMNWHHGGYGRNIIQTLDVEVVA
jgi:sulfite dehydrogenase